MNCIKKLYCRTVQTAFRAVMPLLPYREPIVFDKIEALEQPLLQHGVTSVLLIAGKRLRSTGATEGLEELLRKNNIACTIYDETKANPTVFNAQAALDLYKRAHCDCLIAFGGGSSVDCAKAVGALVAYPNKTLNDLQGVMRVRRKIPLLIAIPTTAGTGSEVTLAAVITDSETKHKYAINSFPLIPSYAVLDPVVTYTLPPFLTATTGMDALTHAVEAYIGNSTTKKTRRQASAATALVFENLETAVRDGQNETARKNMLTASYLAGAAFSRSYVGYVHAVAHSLGGAYDIPHGLANAVLLPVVLEAYGKSAHKKLRRLAVAAHIANKTDSPELAAEKFIEKIRELNEKTGIPNSLPEINAKDVPALAKHAAREANPLYPVPKLMDERELRRIYFAVIPAP